MVPPLNGAEGNMQLLPIETVAKTAEIPEPFRPYVTEQAYDAYTESEHEVWRTLHGRMVRFIDQFRERIHPAHLRGFEQLILPWTSIPRLSDVNRKLAPLGWSATCVNGYLPAEVYAGLVAHRIFPVSRNLRKREHLDFSYTPDMAHDLFGHIPMLVSEAHTEFLERLSRAMSLLTPSRWDAELYEANRAMSVLRGDPLCPGWALRSAEERVLRVQQRMHAEPSALTRLGRMYLWSIEFGMMQGDFGPVAYGAALLSAPTEMRLACSRTAKWVPYSLDVVNHDIHFSDPQLRYFVASGYPDLHRVLAMFTHEGAALASSQESL